jgi:hypothetical protein
VEEQKEQLSTTNFELKREKSLSKKSVKKERLDLKRNESRNESDRVIEIERIDDESDEDNGRMVYKL